MVVVIELETRVKGVPPYRHRWWWRADMRARKLNDERTLLTELGYPYRWVVRRDDDRWVVVAMQNQLREL